MRCSKAQLTPSNKNKHSTLRKFLHFFEVAFKSFGILCLHCCSGVTFCSSSIFLFLPVDVATLRALLRCSHSTVSHILPPRVPIPLRRIADTSNAKIRDHTFRWCRSLRHTSQKRTHAFPTQNTVALSTPRCTLILCPAAFRGTLFSHTEWRSPGTEKPDTFSNHTSSPYLNTENTHYFLLGESMLVGSVSLYART